MYTDDGLDERKKRILKAIIDDYIDTAEPVGSRTVAKKYDLSLSSATIRNEMSDLEELGYLAQPHTSAGRIPSDKGYRLYVDQLMKINDLTIEEAENIKRAMEVKINELSQLIRQASIIVSKITRYTSMAITPQMNKVTLKAVQIVPIDFGRALVVVVANAGVVKNTVVDIRGNISPDFLIRISNIFNEKLSGLTIEGINLQVINEIESEVGMKKEVLFPFIDGVAKCINQIDVSDVYLDGTTNIFDYPEFNNLIKAREFLDILEEKDILISILKKRIKNKGINIKIGQENEIDKIKDCSLITATYSLRDLDIGTIGVIGPTRMEYSRVISSMNYIRALINKEIIKLIGKDFEG